LIPRLGNAVRILGQESFAFKVVVEDSRFPRKFELEISVRKTIQNDAKYN
jgi:hypothetical protein